MFLIGYMGSGKTTLGRAVSHESGMQFIDLDLYIENRFHTSVSAIFAEKGEDGFRRIERDILREVGEFENVIIACGGGTPCFFDNMDYMNSRGLTVYLDCPVDRLFSRLSVARAKRPLIARMSDEELRGFISSALAARMPHYSKARMSFPSSLLENRREISESVSRFLDMIAHPLTNHNQP